MMAEPDHDYLARLLLYYEEEIEGEAYFAALSTKFDTAEHRRCLDLLTEVERHAAEGVAPLVSIYGLWPRARTDLVRSGQAQADATAVDWPALLADMRRTYPGYLAAFEGLEAMAPPEDRARLAFLTAHEVAAMAFLDLADQDLQAATAPLERYLSQTPEGHA